MTVRSFRFLTLRPSLAVGASAVAMALAPIAHAQPREESVVYVLRHNSETADGVSIMSTTEDIAVGRSRVGDKSIMVFDHQAGAITLEHAGHTAILPLTSRMGVERSFGFDYADQRARGNDLTAFEFNAYVRPLLGKAPPLGANASWSTTTDIAALGLVVSNATPIRIDLKRTYFRNNGEDVVLVEFDAPAFTYTTRDGEAVVHWARGFAVTDPAFSQIHLLTTQHRAALRGPDGSIRPFSERTSLNAVEADGSWSMSFENAPQVQAALDRLVELRGDAVAMTTERRGDAPVRNVPGLLARRLNMAAFGIAENGGNPISIGGGPPGIPPMQFGGPVSPEMAEVMRTGIIPTDPNHPYHRNSPFGPPTPEQIEIMQQFLDDTPGFLTTAPMQGGLLQPGGSTNPTYGDEVNDLLQRFQADVIDAIRVMLEGQAESARTTTSVLTTGGPPSEVAAFRSQAGDALRAQGMSDQEADRLLNALLQPDRSRDLAERTQELVDYRSSVFGIAGGIAERSREGAPAPSDVVLSDLLEMFRLQDSSLRIEERLKDGWENDAAELERAGWSVDDPKFQAKAAEAAATQESILNARYERILQQIRLSEYPLPPGADLGNQLVPGWIDDANNAEIAEYNRLVAELERELEDLRRRLDGDSTDDAEPAKREPGFGEDDDFYTNNAFDYTSMVGIVATDLSRWGEWLATQNVRELERLARLIGYPNLASALADAENIIRRSEDPGYRQWAMQAPSCAGYVGCGPNYLERWWQKQANVALGDILAGSRDIFSSGGFSDIGISGLNLAYLLRDHALEDGDIVQIRISQFGKVIYEGQVNLTNAGEIFDLMVGRGVASLEIFAVNEGFSSPNTAQITVDNVVRGEATQTYSLQTGETATLRIEAGAKPGPSTGTPGAGQ